MRTAFSRLQGALRQPDSMEVNADVTRIAFDYEFVQLTNDKDIRITYRRNEVRIDQARVHGADTDFQFSGSARFDRDRPLRLAVAGGVNLRLLKGILPDLDAQGTADANVSIDGTLSAPRITGRAAVRNASANYADFPVGLSKMNGDLVFDKSRLVFDRMTAESGGGQLTLSGSASYGEGPMRYEVNATTPQVRVRYPTGMSWLVGGNLGTFRNEQCRGAERAGAGAAAAVCRGGGCRFVLCGIVGHVGRAVHEFALSAKLKRSMSRARRIPERGSNGRGRKWKSMETCGCEAHGTDRCCWETFICLAVKCRFGETLTS